MCLTNHARFTIISENGFPDFCALSNKWHQNLIHCDCHQTGNWHKSEKGETNLFFRAGGKYHTYVCEFPILQAQANI